MTFAMIRHSKTYLRQLHLCRGHPFQGSHLLNQLIPVCQCDKSTSLIRVDMVVVHDKGSKGDPSILFRITIEHLSRLSSSPRVSSISVESFKKHAEKE